MNRNMRRLLQRQAGGKDSIVYGRRAVNDMNAQELFNELVDDACAWLPTPLPRMVPALERLAKLWKKTPEQVFNDLVAAKTVKSGNSMMPGTVPGPMSFN